MLGLGLKVSRRGDGQGREGGDDGLVGGPPLRAINRPNATSFARSRRLEQIGHFIPGLYYHRVGQKLTGRLERSLPWSIGKAGNSSNGPDEPFWTKSDLPYHRGGLYHALVQSCGRLSTLPYD